MSPAASVNIRIAQAAHHVNADAAGAPLTGAAQARRTIQPGDHSKASAPRASGTATTGTASSVRLGGSGFLKTLL
jgi:hypothetical protein